MEQAHPEKGIDFSSLLSYNIVFQIMFETQVVGQAAGLSAQAGRLGHQFIVQNPNHYLNVYSINFG